MSGRIEGWCAECGRTSAQGATLVRERDTEICVSCKRAVEGRKFVSSISSNNPILVELRTNANAYGLEQAAKDGLGAVLFGEWHAETTFQQRQHARRVLHKLITLTESEPTK
jgi:hypothetical protein